MHMIQGASFSIQALDAKKYELKVVFEGGGICRKITFAQACLPSEQNVRIWDLFTKNAITCQKLFTQKDTKDVKRALKHVIEPSPPSLMVLDMKDAHVGYFSRDLRSQELAVCEFFSKDRPNECAKTCAAKVHALLKGKLDFVLLEGTLKSDILKDAGFSEGECAFLNSKEGATSFCQLAEFFMNAFKLGQEATIDGRTFSAKEYIVPVQNRYQAFSCFQISTVLYPREYQEMYSPEGMFAQSLKPVFSMRARVFQESQITQMDVERLQ